MRSAEAQKVAHREAARRHYWKNRERMRETARAYSAAHPDIVAETRARHKAKNPTASRDWKRAHKDQLSEANKGYYRRRGQFVIRMREYGLTQEHFEAMLESQANACAICGLQFGVGKALAPHVDHDHDTGRVRALLCNNCNFLIGYCREEPATLVAAARYLEQQKEATA